jgi:hypothetical protein
VTPVARTPAEYTVLRLQEAARGGSPLLIPGALEPRAVAPVVPLTRNTDPRGSVVTQTSVVSDSERLARELEGGGASSQRPRGHRASVLARLWRSALHPMEIGMIWSRTLPQAR